MPGLVICIICVFFDSLTTFLINFGKQRTEKGGGKQTLRMISFFILRYHAIFEIKKLHHLNKFSIKNTNVL